jgi:anti-sigma factor RsiW
MNPELDEKLSALLDGELSPQEEAALRAEIARSPELAARLAAFAGLDERLRALPSRPVPADLHARVAERTRGAPARGAPRSGAPPARRRWLAAAALAAAAAALALLVLPRAPREATQVARVEPPPVPLAPPLAVEPEVPALPEPAPTPAPTPTPAPAPQRLALDEDSEAEDLPVIAVLDVLAELDELEEVGSG